MKKFFLLFVAVLMTMTCANAVDWQPIDTKLPNFSLYLDNDSVRNVGGNEWVYAIKYQSGNKPEQVVYLKSDYTKNYIGIISKGDYSSNTYRPSGILCNTHVFMKPLNKNSFLNYTHVYIIETVADKELAYARARAQARANTSEIANVNANIFTPEKNANFVNNQQVKPEFKNVSYNMKLTSKEYTNTKNLKKYVSETAQKIDENWFPPSSGRNKQAIIIVEIGADGGLLNYKFAKSSGDVAMDRSIITAIEKTVPYTSFSEFAEQTDSLSFQFVFDYKLLKKSVM